MTYALSGKINISKLLMRKLGIKYAINHYYIVNYWKIMFCIKPNAVISTFCRKLLNNTRNVFQYGLVFKHWIYRFYSNSWDTQAL